MKLTKDETLVQEGGHALNAMLHGKFQRRISNGVRIVPDTLENRGLKFLA